MRLRHLSYGIHVATAVLLLAVAGVHASWCDEPDDRTSPEATPVLAPARKAAEHGLVFLEADAAKWRKEHQCASCHQGTMTVWALSEAKSQGYAVNAES